ncbi:alpha-amylase family protein [Shewanella sp. 10N.286.52.B9]|uniref:alpha-amylase family protein n=1 Tax=Shewanella sp. 10N.286.52.B9 TaxID=1880837 RepID=UPI000C835F74|nr:alpha-amylase family protein [Shewanella sp. 10N.286.52.B9]
MYLQKFSVSLPIKLGLVLTGVSMVIAGCATDKASINETVKQSGTEQLSAAAQPLTGKPVVYQVFTRLYGNTNTTNKPWGTIQDNGVGKFSDFTDIALQDIKSLGTTHVWYTGVPHHALINNYTDIGISNDDPDVVKGRAGSPYAVKDYYNVNPDLANDPANRLAEFEALISRTHQNGMQVIIDIVPNHVARQYQSAPQNSPLPANRNFGEQDNTAVEYDKNNNFYYIVGESFSVPDAKDNYQPLSGESHPLADGQFIETPAKWTGNGSRLAKPDANDWYETVKVNYGVKPDGSYDFPTLPSEYAQMSSAQHYQFWQTQPLSDIPDSWVKFKHITEFWLAKGVDGFRYDMAEMVPVEFWSYLNSNIKHLNPNAFLLAEVYNPSLYRDYIHLGKMDYLYDKVDLYDTLKDIIHGKKSTAEIAADQAKIADIEQHMLNFLENHDEQRINTGDFAGSAEAALPAMVVSTTISRSPTLLYFGQDVGEKAEQDAGFGQASRTSIFDYVGVPAHQRWMNNGKFDGGQSTDAEKALRKYYQTLVNLSHTAPALQGEYFELDTFNRAVSQKTNQQGYNDNTFAFSRYNDEQFMLVVTNFSDSQAASINLHLPEALITEAQIKDGSYQIENLLTIGANENHPMNVVKQQASIAINLQPLESQVLVINW